MNSNKRFVNIATGVHHNGTPFIVATDDDGIAYITHCRIVDDRGYFDRWQALPEHPMEYAKRIKMEDEFFNRGWNDAMRHVAEVRAAEIAAATIHQNMVDVPVAEPVAEQAKQHWLAAVWEPYRGRPDARS